MLPPEILKMLADWLDAPSLWALKLTCVRLSLLLNDMPLKLTLVNMSKLFEDDKDVPKRSPLNELFVESASRGYFSLLCLFKRLGASWVGAAHKYRGRIKSCPDVDEALESWSHQQSVEQVRRYSIIGMIILDFTPRCVPIKSAISDFIPHEFTDELKYGQHNRCDIIGVETYESIISHYISEKTRDLDRLAASEKNQTSEKKNEKTRDLDQLVISEKNQISEKKNEKKERARQWRRGVHTQYGKHSWGGKPMRNKDRHCTRR